MGKKPDTTGREVYSHSDEEPIPWLPDPMCHSGVYEYLPDPFIGAAAKVLTNNVWANVKLTAKNGHVIEYRYLTEDEAAEWAVEIEEAKRKAVKDA